MSQPDSLLQRVLAEAGRHLATLNDNAQNPATITSQRKGSSMATKKNSPTHTAYMVREFKSDGKDRAIWTRIGSVWTHEGGEGFNVQLNAFPVDGRIVVRSVKEKVDTTNDASDDDISY